MLLSAAARPVLAVRCLKQVNSVVQTHNIKQLLISLQSLEEFEFEFVSHTCAYHRAFTTLANAEKP